MVPALLFPLIPIAILSWFSKGHAAGLFGPVGWWEIKLIFQFALPNIEITRPVGGIVKFALGASANPA